MNYSEKLKSPKWQKKRLQILERDDFTCIICGDIESELHVHHRWYEKDTDPWDYPDVVYQTLCKSCHERVKKESREKLKKEVEEIINKLSTNEIEEVAVNLYVEFILPIALYKGGFNG